MRLVRVRVTNYRSIKDSEWIDLENHKTILVGPNEAGKTALLRAIQQLNPPDDVPKLDPLRDYPRKDYNDITTKRIVPSKIDVVVGVFELEDSDKLNLDDDFKSVKYTLGRRLDNSCWSKIDNEPDRPTTSSVKKDLQRLAAHVDARIPEGQDKPSIALGAIIDSWGERNYYLIDNYARQINEWLNGVVALIDESNADEENRYDRLQKAVEHEGRRSIVIKKLYEITPKFILFSNYYRVRPIIHLDHLAIRLEGNLLDDAQYDYGNQCLLKLLGFSARELSDLGKAPEPSPGDSQALQKFRDKLDNRSYQLNAASVKLTDEIVRIWNPSSERHEANRLRIVADGQYLKVVVEDELGVEIELDQRSEGFQWIVSFFIVFFSESKGAYANAILLLDEPGLSLHALKQREFRETVSSLSELNQTIYTTHSPFLVGPDELDLVRVVEMKDRRVGTKVHTTVTAADPAALLPLQEALGYDLAQSLFSHQRNLILEGLTDYWYLDATSNMLRQAGICELNQKISLIPTNTAGKVVYFATILLAHNLKVAALLDSDNAGDQAAKQEVLVHRLGNKRILRTKDYTDPLIPCAEIEDLLRDTLIELAKSEMGIDISVEATANPAKPIVDLLSVKGGGAFSKYKLAKSYVRWTRDHEASDLSASEQKGWVKLIAAVNTALK